MSGVTQRSRRLTSFCLRGRTANVRTASRTSRGSLRLARCFGVARQPGRSLVTLAPKQWLSLTSYALTRTVLLCRRRMTCCRTMRVGCCAKS